MAQVVVTLKIMPKSPEVDLGNIEGEAKTKIIDFSQTKEIKTEQEPIAFGLKALKIIFVMDESTFIENMPPNHDEEDTRSVLVSDKYNLTIKGCVIRIKRKI